MVEAPSGTGCTAAAATLAALRCGALTFSVPRVEVVMLYPSRDLASRAAAEVERLVGPGGVVGLFVGGSPVADDVAALAPGSPCRVAVGTPRRLRTLLTRGALRSGRVGLVVLDGADRLLSDLHLDDTVAVFDACPEGKQVVLLSTPLPAPLRRDAEALTDAPVRVCLPGAASVPTPAQMAADGASDDVTTRLAHLGMGERLPMSRGGGDEPGIPSGRGSEAHSVEERTHASPSMAPASPSLLETDKRLPMEEAELAWWRWRHEWWLWLRDSTPFVAERQLGAGEGTRGGDWS